MKTDGRKSELIKLSDFMWLKPNHLKHGMEDLYLLSLSFQVTSSSRRRGHMFSRKSFLQKIIKEEWLETCSNQCVLVLFSRIYDFLMGLLFLSRFCGCVTECTKCIVSDAGLTSPCLCMKLQLHEVISAEEILTPNLPRYSIPNLTLRFLCRRPKQEFFS